MPGSPADRYQPLPGLLQIPGRLWSRLSRRGRAATTVVGVIVAVGAAFGVSALVRTGERQAREQHAAEARRTQAERRRIAEDQRPRTARLPRAAGSPTAPGARRALERGITRDVRARVSAGLLDGPVTTTICEAVGGPKPVGAAGGYNCFTLGTTTRSTYTIETGYRFSARVDAGRGTIAWCKRNPRPIHPDTGYFLTVPVSRSCLP